jgi:Peptidase_C39 like family
MRKTLIALVTAALAVAPVLTAPLASANPAGMRPVSVAGEHVLSVDYQVQQTGYWCGPAATRIALSARGIYRTQSQLAAQLGTTTNGTDWIGQVTNVLSGYVGWYETKEMPNDPPTQAQRDLLWRDVVLNINNNYPIVANIVAPANNHPPGYPNYTIYHYFTVIGYNDSNQTVKIADPANFGGHQIYWLTFNQLATLIPPKGYSA